MFFLLLLTIHYCCFKSNGFYFFFSECCLWASTACFLMFLACMRTHSRGCSWALFLWQNRGASDYSFILKWCPFYFQPLYFSRVQYFGSFICTGMFASLIQWNVWHNQSSLGIFFLEETKRHSLNENGGSSENTWSWLCCQMRFHHLNQRMPVILKRGKLLHSTGCFCMFHVLFRGHQVWAILLFHKDDDKKDWREAHFQARVCKMVIAVCYFKSSPFLPKRTELILGEVCTKPYCPPLHTFPTPFLTSKRCQVLWV